MSQGLFIDIGLTNIGYTIGSTKEKDLITYKYFKTIGNNVEDKLLEIYNEFLDIIKHNDIKLICYEKAYFNGKQGFNLGCVMGTLLLLVAENKLNLLEITAKTIKKTVTNNGNCNKEDIYNELNKHFDLEKNLINHVTDSIGLYFTYLKLNDLI